MYYLISKIKYKKVFNRLHYDVLTTLVVSRRGFNISYLLLIIDIGRMSPRLGTKVGSLESQKLRSQKDRKSKTQKSKIREVGNLGVRIMGNGEFESWEHGKSGTKESET